MCPIADYIGSCRPSSTGSVPSSSTAAGPVSPAPITFFRARSRRCRRMTLSCACCPPKRILPPTPKVLTREHPSTPLTTARLPDLATNGFISPAPLLAGPTKGLRRPASTSTQVSGRASASRRRRVYLFSTFLSPHQPCLAAAAAVGTSHPCLDGRMAGPSTALRSANTVSALPASSIFHDSLKLKPPTMRRLQARPPDDPTSRRPRLLWLRRPLQLGAIRAALPSGAAGHEGLASRGLEGRFQLGPRRL